MFSRIQDGLIQETGPLAVYEGSARMKMTPFWFGFGRGELFFKRRALWPWAKDQPAWRRRLLFHLILKLLGRQSERRGNNFICSSTIIGHKNTRFSFSFVNWLESSLSIRFLIVFVILNKVICYSFVMMIIIGYCMCNNIYEAFHVNCPSALRASPKSCYF